MNTTQIVILTLWGVASLAGVLFGVKVLRSTVGPASTPPEDAGTLEAREHGWFLIAAALLVGLVIATLASVPYFSKAEAGTQRVKITGQQYAWVVAPREIKVGQPVEFVITSKDVAHAVGIYRGSRLEMQVQAGPEVTQRYVHTFDRPGRYKILCLEFCGAGHHLMRADLEVR